MKLDKENFAGIIDATPLVSIDLILRNERDEILLGRRTNRPAQGYWFVPGGRIRKNEKSQDALQRIAQAELGTAIAPGKLLGIFDHFYADNYFEIEGISTHYVVLGYQSRLDSSTRLQPDAQHGELKWWPVDQLLRSNDVHDNSKLYFRDARDNGFRCSST
jgi:colanic acid biosynthesis protein WcaH